MIRITGLGRTTSDHRLIAIQQIGYHGSEEVEWLYSLPRPQGQGSVAAPVASMTYNDDNQLAAFQGQTSSHDLDGNMTWGPLPDGTMAEYAYNARDPLGRAWMCCPGWTPR